MKKIALIICLFFVIKCLLAVPCFSQAEVLLPGQMVEISDQNVFFFDEYRKVSGLKNKPAIIKFNSNHKKLDLPPDSKIIEIKSKSILYLPNSMEVVAIQPKIYSNENFSEEIQKHYKINFTVYTILLMTYGALALSR